MTQRAAESEARMPPDETTADFDFRFLDSASASLLGYFVHTWYTHYLSVIVANLRRWEENGLIRSLFEPTERGAYSMLFDFNALNMEKAVYINGIYFYILSCHKAANHRLMNRCEEKQVLYLRGFDFEASVATGGNLATGFSSIDSERFNAMLAEQLSPYFPVFKALSPKDVYWETVEAQRYFYGDFDGMIRLTKQPFRSIYVNALFWKEGIAHLFDRMDHFVVYVSSMTESALWELEQLDTDDRRGRVTVVFDEKAIENKELQLDVQHKMQDEFGEKVIWSKQGQPPYQTSAELREHLSLRFLLTTPDAFKKDISEHRRRIAGDSARLPPGERETWLDFRFHPAVDADKLQELGDFSAEVQEQIAACKGEKGINCLPLFLNHVQLRIFLTLLMGEHHATGHAFGDYAAVMQGALDYYGRPGGNDLTPEKREFHLGLLQDHLEMAQHIGLRLLAYGKSHEFDDFSAIATAEFKATFDESKAAVAKFFETAAVRRAV